MEKILAFQNIARIFILINLMLLSGCWPFGSSFQPTYSLSINVSGLTGSLTLANGSDTITLDADGTAVLSKNLVKGTFYDVSVTSQPDKQYCTMTDSSGKIADHDVTVDVRCSSGYSLYSVKVKGLDGELTLQLRSLSGAVIHDRIDINKDGKYAFPVKVLSSSAVSLFERFKPPQQRCEYSNENGLMTKDRIATVTCNTLDTFPLKVNVQGLTGSGLEISNLYVKDEKLQVNEDGDYSFSAELTRGSKYLLNITQQPEGQLCSLSEDSIGSLDFYTSYFLPTNNVTCSKESEFGTLQLTGDAVQQFGDAFHATAVDVNSAALTYRTINTWLDGSGVYKKLVANFSPYYSELIFIQGNNLDIPVHKWETSDRKYSDLQVTLDPINDQVIFNASELNGVRQTTSDLTLNGALTTGESVTPYDSGGVEPPKCDRDKTSNSGTLVIKVLDSVTNVAIENAIVQLDRNGTQVVTNAEGVADFGTVFGTHDVHVFAPAYTWVSTYCVQPDVNLNTTIFLKPFRDLSSNSVINTRIVSVTGLDNGYGTNGEFDDVSNFLSLALLDQQGDQIGEVQYRDHDTKQALMYLDVPPGTTIHNAQLWAVERVYGEPWFDSWYRFRGVRDAVQIPIPASITTAEKDDPVDTLRVTADFTIPSQEPTEKARVTNTLAPNWMNHWRQPHEIFFLDQGGFNKFFQMESDIFRRYPKIYQSFEPAGLPDVLAVGSAVAKTRGYGFDWDFYHYLKPGDEVALITAFADPPFFDDISTSVSQPIISWEPVTMNPDGAGLTAMHVKLTSAFQRSVKWSLYVPPGESGIELPVIPTDIAPNIRPDVTYRIFAQGIAYHGIKYAESLSQQILTNPYYELDSSNRSYEVLEHNPFSWDITFRMHSD